VEIASRFSYHIEEAVLMGSKSSPAISAVAILGLALAAVIGLKSTHQVPDVASGISWVGSISAEAKTQHVHPRMDDATLLSLTPTEGRFATRMNAWFPLYDRLEARGLVEIERLDGMYVVRRIAPDCASTSSNGTRPHRCG
jgi:hypothetical protein